MHNKALHKKIYGDKVNKPSKKLTLNLLNKHRQVIHYSALRAYARAGLRITVHEGNILSPTYSSNPNKSKFLLLLLSIFSALSFEECAILSAWVNFASRERKKCSMVMFLYPPPSPSPKIDKMLIFFIFRITT